MWWLYIIECNDKSLYTGITKDIKRRLKEHLNRNGGRYTRSRGVKKLVYKEKYKTRSEVLKREAQIKNWSREKKMGLIKK